MKIHSHFMRKGVLWELKGYSKPYRVWRESIILGVEFYLFLRRLIIFCDVYLDNRRLMVEVIHRYHGYYPFGLDKLNDNTFLLVLKEQLTEEGINQYRLQNKIYREMLAQNFIKLHRILREDAKLHLIYEYQPLSLEKYMESLKQSTNRQDQKYFVEQLHRFIENSIHQLVMAQVKAQLFLNNIAIHKNQDSTVEMKFFIGSDSQYLSLVQHGYRAKDSKGKDQHYCNQQYLLQFYEAEKQRLHLEVQQLAEEMFGKFQDQEKKKTPNFVINGTKLMFLAPEESQKSKDSLKSIGSQQSKEKNLRKAVQSIKAHHQQSKSNNSHNACLKAKEQQAAYERSQRQQIAENSKKKVEKIVNFDQSFEPDFKPEEFTKQNTYVLEENDYLQSLQQQLISLTSDHKGNSTAKSIGNKTGYLLTDKQKEELKRYSKDVEKPKEHMSQPNLPQNSSNSNLASSKSQNHSLNQQQNNSFNKNNSQNNSMGSQQHQGQLICRLEPKETIIQQKIFKYKMKIITSHQIEIEGDGQPNVEQIQREILDGIKSGKLNINDLASNKRTSINRSNQGQNISTENEKQVMSGSTHTEKSASNPREATANRQQKQKISQSNHDRAKKQVHSKAINAQNIQTRSSDLQQNKMRTINEIIQKIGIKTSLNQNQHEPKEQKHSFQKQHHNQEYRTHHQNYNYKDRIQGQDKTENYLAKIKEAKEKAETILKEYAKKKQ